MRHRDLSLQDKIRLQVYLAHAGVASRRASEEIIAAGRVTVNGEVVRVIELEDKFDKEINNNFTNSIYTFIRNICIKWQ